MSSSLQKSPHARETSLSLLPIRRVVGLILLAFACLELAADGVWAGAPVVFVESVTGRVLLHSSPGVVGQSVEVSRVAEPGAFKAPVSFSMREGARCSWMDDRGIRVRGAGEGGLSWRPAGEGLFISRGSWAVDAKVQQVQVCSTHLCVSFTGALLWEEREVHGRDTARVLMTEGAGTMWHPEQPQSTVAIQKGEMANESEGKGWLRPDSPKKVRDGSQSDLGQQFVFWTKTLESSLFEELAKQDSSHTQRKPASTSKSGHKAADAAEEEDQVDLEVDDDSLRLAFSEPKPLTVEQRKKVEGEVEALRSRPASVFVDMLQAKIQGGSYQDVFSRRRQEMKEKADLEKKRAEAHLSPEEIRLRQQREKAARERSQSLAKALTQPTGNRAIASEKPMTHEVSRKPDDGSRRDSHFYEDEDGPAPSYLDSLTGKK